MASKERNSNMELLRVIAMFMIIAFHIYYHCVYVQLTDSDSIARMQNGYFCKPVFDPKLLLLTAFAPLGKAGNAIFLLISGYFTCAGSTGFHLSATIKKLISQQVFAVIMLVIGSTLLFCLGNGTYISMIDANFFNRDMSWFIGYYFLVILIADLGLNRYLSGLDKKGYTKFLLILFAFTQFEWAAGLLKNLSSGLSTLTAGVFLFSLGGFIRLYDPLRKIRTSALAALIAVCYGFVFLAAFNVAENEIQTYLRSGSSKLFIQSLPKYTDTYLIPILIGLCIFELFRRLRMKPNKIINFLGGSTLMIYLIHDNKFFYSLWDIEDWISLLYHHPIGYLAAHLGWTFLSFLIGLYVYILYLLLRKLFGSKHSLFLIREDLNRENSEQ